MNTYVLLDALVAKLGLVTRESETGDGGAVVVLGHECAERTPAAANVENAVVGLEVKLRGVRGYHLSDHDSKYKHLLANDGELVVLELLKRLLLLEGADDAGGVNHAGSEEPAVKVVTA